MHITINRKRTEVMVCLKDPENMNIEMDNSKVRHLRCVEPKLQKGKNTVKTQLYMLAMRGWITQQFTTTCFGLYRPCILYSFTL